MTRLLFILACVAAQSANPGDALRGWSAVTWGMTVAEARAALGPDATVPADPPAPNLDLIDRVVVPSLRIGPIAATAAVHSAPGAETISAVTLTAGDIYDSTASRSNAFGELKRLLIEKYGSPRDEQSKPAGRGDTTRTALWTFRYTTITLTWFESSPRYSLGFVRIRYQARDPKAADIL